MNDEYLRYLQSELREAYKVKREFGDEAKNMPELQAKIKHLCNEIYDLEMKTRWRR